MKYPKEVRDMLSRIQVCRERVQGDLYRESNLGAVAATLLWVLGDSDKPLEFIVERIIENKVDSEAARLSEELALEAEAV